jgi:hypothetical protein
VGHGTWYRSHPSFPGGRVSPECLVADDIDNTGLAAPPFGGVKNHFDADHGKTNKHLPLQVHEHRDYGNNPVYGMNNINPEQV